MATFSGFAHLSPCGKLWPTVDHVHKEGDNDTAIVPIKAKLLAEKGDGFRLKAKVKNVGKQVQEDYVKQKDDKSVQIYVGKMGSYGQKAQTFDRSRSTEAAQGWVASRLFASQRSIKWDHKHSTMSQTFIQLSIETFF